MKLSRAVALCLSFLLCACGSTTPTSPTPVNYAGVWTGDFNITSCTDVEVTGLTQLFLCRGLIRTQTYRFTLTQSGSIVTGSYQLVTAFYSCACAGDFGTFDMSGTVGSDGALTITATGIPRASGVTAVVTFALRQSSTSTIAGTVSGRLRFNTPEDRSVFTGVLTSGSR